jgi:hypothetical protein
LRTRKSECGTGGEEEEKEEEGRYGSKREKGFG